MEENNVGPCFTDPTQPRRMVGEEWTLESLIIYRRDVEDAIRSRFHVGVPSFITFTSEDAEDAVQLAYCAIWRKITAGDHLVFTGDQAYHFVLLVAFRAAVNIYRRKKGRWVRRGTRPTERLVEEFEPFDRPSRESLNQPEIEDIKSVGDFLSRVCGLKGKASDVLTRLLAGHPMECVTQELSLTQPHFAKLRWRAVCQMRRRLHSDPVSEARIRMALE